MEPRNLARYTVNEAMLKHDLGVGVVTMYQLKDGRSFFIMAEYHNKGALSPTVGGRISQEQTIYDALNGAFERKRLGKIGFEDGQIDAERILYSVNEKQNFARLTFLHKVSINLTEEEFIENYVAPMHLEAQYQRSVSEFFWKLDETVNPARADSKFKFTSVEERSIAATKALQNINMSQFPMSEVIKDKLLNLQSEQYVWDETKLPLAFYGDNGGRKYSEFTGFYLMSFSDILKQLREPKIKSARSDQDKPTVFIEHDSLPKNEKWKKYFIFEDEIKVIAEIMHVLISESKNNTTLFSSTHISKPIADLVSPWITQQIDFNQLKLLDTSLNLKIK